MFLEAVLLGYLVGWLRGGRSVNIGSVRLKGWLFIVVAFLLQMLPMVFGRMAWMYEHGNLVAFLTMLMVFFVVVLNIEKRGFWLIVLGATLNLLAMGTNGLKIPVSLTGLAVHGRMEFLESVVNGSVLNYIGFSELSSWSYYLGKIFVLPKYYPLVPFVSVGDLAISLGIAIFVYSYMVSSPFSRSRSQMVASMYPYRTR